LKANLFGLGIPVISLLFLLLTAAKQSKQEEEQIKKAAPVAVKKDSTSNKSLYSNKVNALYDTLQLATTGLSLPVFEKAITGFYNLKSTDNASEKPILSIINFDQLSTEKRLYIIDIEKQELVINTWVAHGITSGRNEAVKFSNTPNSKASSLGFYLTGETYYGKYGRSLRLDGMDQGFNTNARKRAIVLHGAKYVSQATIKNLGHLGRSQGCPAVPFKQLNTVIDHLEDKTVIFINKTTEDYESKYLDVNLAATFVNQELAENVD
jgi:hypothetical protein